MDLNHCQDFWRVVCYRYTMTAKYEQGDLNPTDFPRIRRILYQLSYARIGERRDLNPHKLEPQSSALPICHSHSTDGGI